MLETRQTETVKVDQVYPGATFQSSRCMSTAFLSVAKELGGDKFMQELSPRFKQWKSLVQYVSTHGFLGVMLTTTDHNRWGFITRDFGDSQQFRYTTFDRRGFIGHGTYLTADEACIALFDMGLRIIDDPKRLDEVSSSSSWYIE